MPVLTKADVQKAVEDVVSRRAAADREALTEMWRHCLRRIAEDTRLGGYELVCRPIIDEIIGALCELVPYLDLPAETVHPFIKPEGEKILVGFLIRNLGVIERIRTSLHLFPGTASYDRRVSITKYLEYREGIVREDIGIMRENFRQTQNPRTSLPGSTFVIMKVRTREFEELAGVYMKLLSSVIGADAYRFFWEQYCMVEQELDVVKVMCNASPKEKIH